MALEPLGAARREGPFAGLWELLFPSRCLGCNRRGSLLCAECEAFIPWLPPAVCPRCVEPSRGGRLCPRCERRPRRSLASVRAACAYDGVIRIAIHRIKFQHISSLAPLLGRVVAEPLVRRPIGVDLVAPVPLSGRRSRERGYNQAELIAAEIARLGLLPLPSRGLLTRVRETRPQVGLSAAERRENVRGAFACSDPVSVRGRRVLLFDDVMTTGATLEACAEPLVAAGAAHVVGLVLARNSNIKS